MGELPTVSVVLPSYNHAAYLPDQLRALDEQSIPPDEIILIDDASSDDGAGLMAAFARSRPHVRFVPNERNLGVVESFNRGLRLATGDFVYPCSADDRVLPGLIEKMKRLLGAHPAAGVGVADFAFMDPETSRLYPKHLGLLGHAGYLSPTALVDRLGAAGYILPAYAGFLRRTALLDAGLFPHALRWYNDWFVMLSIGFRQGACYLPEPLAAIRFLASSYSSGVHRWPEQREVVGAVLDLLGTDGSQDVVESFFASGALAYLGAGVVRVALQDPRHRALLARLPYAAILRREARSLLIRLGPPRLRQRFWAARYSLRAPPLGASDTPQDPSLKR